MSCGRRAGPPIPWERPGCAGALPRPGRAGQAGQGYLKAEPPPRRQRPHHLARSHPERARETQDKGELRGRGRPHLPTGQRLRSAHGAWLLVTGERGEPGSPRYASPEPSVGIVLGTDP